jgi:predicted ester cyclase
MKSEQIHAFLERFRIAWQEQDLEAVSDCYVDNCELISPIFHTVRGRSALEHSYRDAFKAFLIVSLKSDEPIIDSEHDRAAVVWTFKAKHQGEIFGVPPTGRTMEITVAFVLTFADGRIAKEVRIYDFAKMLLELGVLRAKA